MARTDVKKFQLKISGRPLNNVQIEGGAAGEQFGCRGSTQRNADLPPPRLRRPCEQASAPLTFVVYRTYKTRPNARALWGCRACRR